MIRVKINPELLRWARERSGIAQEILAEKFKKLPDWEEGEAQPTLKQVEAFARTVHVPIGYLFLTDPPQESIPIPDFRTIAGKAVRRPSPNLLDTIYTCQERQSWYRDFVLVTRQPKLDFVGSVTVEVPHEIVAQAMRKKLGFDLAAHQECPSWEKALRLFIDQAEEAGILVMVSGIVMSNTSRQLDPEEFRGFALSDPFAPLIFVNSNDTKAAQMFTLAHELAHVWLGESALSDLGVEPSLGSQREEVWCNAVAAELLVPLAALQSELQRQDEEPLPELLCRLAHTFKVSKLVILRRLFDAKWINRDIFDSELKQQVERLKEHVKAGGGNFYRTTLARVGHRFAHALVMSTLEGQTLYRDAFRMLGVKKTETFNKLGHEVGVMR
ncbi:MAG: ImmA/IrrE family metallo-endopeptidase [Aphanocapsa feldmannii 277cV]|uniref:ImmA/IrrE family metallo-endopeptidase n=1 Tax=Aphanocapsa feldmannii 277cV TaxID=2507553 RepID=A0A524RPS3_9CHRO|nr:MAG: ImmA/IrrE family metallo-endopeptidase [Aphanocapsa feldmannii 277cV]